MSALANVEVLLVSAGAPWAAERAEGLRAEGAAVRVSHPCEDLLLALGEAPPHLVLIADVAGELAAPAVLRAVRAQEPGVPCLVLVEGEPVAPLLASGDAALLDAAAPLPALVRAVAAVSLPARRAAEAEDKLRRLDDGVRARRRQLEEARQRLEVLEHDLRTPLGIMTGFACNLRDEIDGPTTEAQREGASQIVKAGMRMAGLLDETLELVRAHREPSGDDAPALARRAQRKQLDLAALVAETVGLFRDEAARRGVALEMAGEASVLLWGDAAKLGQAITNLIANALKFTPAGGRVECAAVMRPGEGGRRHAELIVSDNGPGVPAEARAHIFERGYRLERDGGVPGRGLGLAVCREVAKIHGGEISVETSASGGAAFVLALPLDLRTRAPSGILLMRVGDGAGQQIVDALCEGDGFATITPAQLERFLPAAAACEAVVVVPRDERAGALELTLRRIRRSAAR